MQDYLKPDFEKPHRAGKRTWIARILKIDRFGNIITNIHVKDFGDLATRNFTLSLGPQEVNVLARNYAEMRAGRVVPDPGKLGILRGVAESGECREVRQVRDGRGHRVDGLVKSTSPPSDTLFYKSLIPPVTG